MKRLVLPILYRTFAAVIFTGLLSAQVTFTITPNPIVFAGVPAGSLQSQTITIITNIPTPVTVQVQEVFRSFLSISSVPAATAGSPAIAQFTLTADTHGIAASTVLSAIPSGVPLAKVEIPESRQLSSSQCTAGPCIMRLAAGKSQE